MSKQEYLDNDGDGERCKYCGYMKPDDVMSFDIHLPEHIETLTRVWKCQGCGELIGVPVPPTRCEDNK